MKIWAFIIFVFAAASVKSQGLAVSGKILDSGSGEKLIGVTCYDSTNSRVSNSDSEGYYSFVSSKSSITLSFSFVGFKTVTKTFDKSGIYDIELVGGITLDEVEVKPDYNFSQLSSKAILRLPNLLGESDVVKSLQYLPGVQGGSEGSASIFVRGGSADQNLILWDDALIYNVNHLGGFFSVFNPHLVKNVQLYKSYIPVEYGGRGSSVIKISTREGSKEKYETTIDIGVLNQNLTFEGPIKKGKSSFIISARNSNLGVFTSLRNVLASSLSDENRISFYDLSARVNTDLGKNGQLVYSVFHGADTYENIENFNKKLITNRLTWSNTVQSLKYTKYINPKFFFNSSVSQTTYKSSIAFEEEFIETKERSTQSLSNQITDWAGKFRVQYAALPFLDLSIGGEVIRHNFQPSYQNSLIAESEFNNEVISTTEGALYIGTSLRPTKKLNLEIGVRRSQLWTEGRDFYNWEPRLSVEFNPSSKYKWNLSYTQMNQYMHSLSNTGTGFNVEVWVPANAQVPPLNVESMSLGYQGSVNKSISWNQEVYFKNFTNSIMYREGENLSIFQSQDWFEKVNLNGRGRSWGIENAIHISGSKYDLNAAYTWSKTEFMFVGVNNNQWFPFRFDRRHHLSLTGFYDINKKWEMNAAFLLQTGQAFTSPLGVRVDANQLPQFYYTSINNDRFPLYHRLDIGFSKTKITKKGNESKWSFGVYNLYNRKNPAYLDVELNTSEQGSSYQIAPKAILPIIPFIKYQIKF